MIKFDVLATVIGEFGIVYKALFKQNMNSETEIVAVKTLKGINLLLPSCNTCDYIVISFLQECLPVKMCKAW